jgi:hypothetical protein
LALRGVGRESEAESVRFHGHRVTKVDPEVKEGVFWVAGRAATRKPATGGLGPLNRGARGSLGCFPRWFGVPMTGSEAGESEPGPRAGR